MINLFPIQKVIVTIAIIYAVLVVLVLVSIQYFFGNPTVWFSIKIALGGAAILNLILLASIYIGWKWIWSTFPSLNTFLFPNLNGSWNMKIHWNGLNDNRGIVNADAIIKQNLLRISMEVSSEKSDSETMLAYPKKDPESGRPILYYIYRVIPKCTSDNLGDTYHGTAILKLSDSGINELRGNYFTSQKTQGYFVITRK